MSRRNDKNTFPLQPPVFYESDLGPNKLIMAQPDILTDGFDGVEIMGHVNNIEPFDRDKEIAGNLLNKFHEGAMMVSRAAPSIVQPTPLWIEFGSAPSPCYTIPDGLNVIPAVVVTTNFIEYLSKLPQDEKMPLFPGVKAESFADLSYKPAELMLAAGVEEAHHAIVARFMGLKYGIGLGQVSPDNGSVYLAQEIEWQAGRFVLEALKIKNVSSEAVAAHQRRMDAAKEIRRIVGLTDYMTLPFFKEFVTQNIEK